MDRQAIRVRDQQGTYEFAPNAEPEDWADVQEDAMTLQVIEPLQGWGAYRWAVRLGYRDEDATYFVTGDREPTPGDC